MNTNIDIAMEQSLNVRSVVGQEEMVFIETYLKNYLMATAKLNSFNEPDFETRTYLQIVEYIKGLFSLEELYYICLANSTEWAYWKYEELDDLKRNILHFIDYSSWLDDYLGDIEIYKRKVMDLNPIILNLLHELLRVSYLFFDEEIGDFICPDIEKYLLNAELNNTNLTIEKAKNICIRYHNIDSRIAALIKEGLNIKPCWVKSGGVTSVFYMKGKKEIRIQIAASKFKGNGNCKSKSALCVVIPYPTILHKNRIRI